jgi:hypothetical protein
MKNTQPYARLGKYTALVTFVIATIICGLYYFTGDLSYGFGGYFFFLFAVPINIIILIVLIVKSTKAEQPRKIKQGIGLMFLNIPVAIFYFFVGIYFIGVMRITIENNSGKDIININIGGCENEEIQILKNGESETVWIDINGECPISMSYIDVNGETQNEMVIGYVTSGMGKKYTHHVGQGETGR